MFFKDYRNFFSAFFIIAAGGLLFYVLKPYIPQKLFTEKKDISNIVVDSLMIKAMETNIRVASPIVRDSVIVKNIKKSIGDNIATAIQKDTTGIIDKQPFNASLIKTTDFNYNKVHPTDSTGNIAIPTSITLKSYKGSENLEHFFEKLYALEQSKEGKVRIAYYGDSMVDGDLIVQDFRSALQNRFGGRGVGFVPIKSESARSRYSVKHYLKGNWKESNYMKSSADSIPYGINGAVFLPLDSTATVKYLASGIKNAYRLNSPILYYGKGNKRAVLAVHLDNDTLIQSIALDGTQVLNKVSLSQNNLKEINLNFSGANKTPIYGIDFSDATGVAVDGFSNRGNSGLPLSLLNVPHMNRFDHELGYDLIILQFGANVLTRQSKNYNWYSSRMGKVIAHLRQAFPQADILILGTADKATKIKNTVQTDTSVVKLLRSQQYYAAKTKSAFISLFHLMGGENSMPIWTDNKLANNDFTHFSPQGSRKIGRLLYKELMDDYSAFAKARSTQISTQKQTDSLMVVQKIDTLQNPTTND